MPEADAGLEWMGRALDLAADPRAPRGENPRVGCVILDAEGRLVGEGFHLGAGTAHAEVVALAQAGDQARGGTAIVTLEPCRHTGRTGPCAQALIDAGITRVVFAQREPTSVAGGGGEYLRDAGVVVIPGVRADDAYALNREWTIAVQRGRPFVTAKMAVSLDGRVAGEGGKRVQITGPQAKVYAHQIRARVQAVVTGSGTALRDDPTLTVREVDVPVSGQPLRVVVGRRQLPASLRLFDDAAPTLVSHERDPERLLADLYHRGVRHALLECGPTMLRAYWQAGLVDEMDWLLAGVWLGAGPRVFPEGERLDEQVTVSSVEPLGQDVLVRVRPEDPGNREDR